MDPNLRKYDNEPAELANFRRAFLTAKDARAPKEEMRRKCVAYFNGDQLDEKVLAGLRKRKQPPIKLNEIRPTVNVLTGLFRSQKLDWSCKPVGPEDAPAAELKEQLLKHFQDASQLAYVEPEVADDMAIGGKGYIFVEPAASGYGLRCRRIPAEYVYVDPYARDYDLNEDASYVDIAKWLTLDQCKLLWPKFAEDFEACVVMRDYDDKQGEEEIRHVLNDPFGPDADWKPWFGEFVEPDKKWLRVIEHWYRRDEQASFYCFGTKETEITDDFEITDAHVEALILKQAHIKTRLVRRIRRAIWTCNILIEDGPSPHWVDRYPIVRWAGFLTPDGDAQGIVHDLIDPQDVINKSWSKSTWHRMANQLFAEQNVFVAGMQKARDEINKPDAALEVKAGMLDKFRIDRGDAKIAQEMGALQFAIDRIRRISGINEEMRGERGQAESRVAIDAKREQAYTMQGVLFDHRVRSWVLLGELLLAMAAQYITGEYAFEVTNNDGTKAWKVINKRVYDPELGTEVLENSIAEGRVNIKVVDAPLSDTEVDKLTDMLVKSNQMLPPDMAAMLAHLPIMISKLPQQYKEEYRKIAEAYRARVMGPSPEEQMAMAQQQMGGMPPESMAGMTPDAMQQGLPQDGPGMMVPPDQMVMAG